MEKRGAVAKSGKGEIILEILILICCFSLYCYWACSMPTLQAPDEPMRFAVPKFIYENGYLPHGGDASIRNEIWGTSYGFSVYGSSLLAVFLMHLSSVLGFESPESLLIAARMASVLFATGTVFLCFRIGDLLFERKASSVLLGVFVGLLPQFVFLASYFNSDMMGIFSTALVFLFLIRGFQRSWKIRDCIYLGLSLGVCALSYYYAYGVIVTSIVVYFASNISVFRSMSSDDSRIRKYITKPLIVLLFALLVAGWFFVRNLVLYGDFFGMSASSANAEIYAADDFKPSNHVTPRSLGWSPFEMLFVFDYANIPWINFSLRSFIGMFGPMSIAIGHTIYYVYGIVLGFGALAGLIYCCVNLSKENNGLLLTMCLITLIIPVILSVYYSWSSDYQAQGRYLMGGLVPLMILATKGWEFVVSLIGRRIENGAPNAIRERRSRCFSEGFLYIVALCWASLFFYVFAKIITVQCVGGLFS